LIVDDHVLFAEAMTVALRNRKMEIVRAYTAAEALEAVGSDRFDLVLMDIGLPDRSGLSVGAQIVAEHDDLKVLAVTALDDPDAAVRAIRSGFHGYITKDTDLTRFIAAIESALGGQVVMPRRLTRKETGKEARGDYLAALIASLTTREREVLALLTEGKNGSRIAETLRISQNTVRTHVQSILTKLQVHSRLEAAAFAVQHGLVENRGSG
jgi:two-component system, NarL family, nitrate/nitrite response regulator NarL